MLVVRSDTSTFSPGLWYYYLPLRVAVLGGRMLFGVVFGVLVFDGA